MDYKKVYTTALKDNGVSLRMGPFILIVVVAQDDFALIRLLFWSLAE